MSTVPALSLASAPLATASPDARAASATGGIDPPPSAGPDPSAPPAPREPIANPACARKVIRIFCESPDLPHSVRTFVEMPLAQLMGEVRAAFNLGDRRFILKLRHESQLDIDTQSMLQVALNHWKRLGHAQLPLYVHFPVASLFPSPVEMAPIVVINDVGNSQLMTELRYEEATAAGAKWRKAHPTIAIKIWTDVPRRHMIYMISMIYNA